MALQWTVIVLDRVSEPGVTREQDLTAPDVLGVDMRQSVFRPTTHPRPSESRLVLSFPIATPNLNIRELMQVWAGWRDPSTLVWSDLDPFGQVSPPFGGYITALAETTYGGEKQFDCTLVDYGILLTRTPVLGWPTFQTVGIGPGYPPGWSVRDWVVGLAGEGRPFDGVLPAHLGNGCRWDGVEPVFDQLIFDAGSLPGIVDAQFGVLQHAAHFTFVGLDKAVQNIADAAYLLYSKHYYTGSNFQIGYWMSAVADGTRIVPRFNMRNMLDTVGPADLTIVGDTVWQLGEIPMQTPHAHKRDPSDVLQRVVMIGVGSDLTQVAPGHEMEAPVIYADYSDPTHLAQYPTDYQLTPGWSGDPLVETRLHTQALANTLATYIEQRMWGPKGSIEFVVDVPIVPGMRVRLRDPNEGQDQIFVVTDVTLSGDSAGHPLWQVKAGYTQPTLNDLLKGGLPDVMLADEDLRFNMSYETRAYPGSIKELPPELQPSTPMRNWLTSGYSDSPALTLQGTTQARPQADGSPDPNPTTRPPFQVKGAVTDATPNPTNGTWASTLDGRPHPNSLHLGAFSNDDTFPVTLAVYQIVLTGVDLAGTGSVVLNKNGGAATGTITGDGHHALSPAVTLNPSTGPGVAGDRLSLTVSGSSSTDPLYVVIWEA